MNIMDFIPKGRANAIKGSKRADELGITPREVRKLVMQARNKGECILNVGGGNKGYFIPILPEELKYVEKEYDSVMARIYPATMAAETLSQVFEVYQ